MKIREKLEELPDHGHYAVCAGRKKEIDDLSTKIIVYSIGTALIFLFLTYIGAPIAAISWIPSLFGCSTCVPYLFSQTAELLLIVLAAFLGYGRRKMLHIVLFFLFVILITASLFDGTAIDIVTFLIGVLGALLTFPCFRELSDYDQLKALEGWPHFSIHVAEAREHPTFTTRYMAEYTESPPYEPPKASFGTPEPVRAALSEMPSLGAGEMPDIPLAAVSAAASPLIVLSRSDPEMPDGRFFVPDSGLSEDIFNIQQ